MKVIVVGGGTSGLMASVSAALAGAEVILLDKNPSLGRKLLLTGGTRCNVTNIRSRDEIIKHTRETDASYIVPFPNLITKTLLSFSKTEEFN